MSARREAGLAARADVAAAVLEATVARLLAAGDPAGAVAVAHAEARSPARDAALGMARLAAGETAAALRDLHAARAGGDTRPATSLNLALAECAAGDPARGVTLLRALEAARPDWAEPAFRLGEHLRPSGDAAAALDAYARALRRAPDHPGALRGLCAVPPPAADAGPVLDLLRCCCAAPSATWRTWDALATVLAHAGETAAAHAAIRRALPLGRGVLAVATRLAETALAAGLADSTLAFLEARAAADPLDPCAAAARGMLLGGMGRHAEAADALDVAATLAPADPTLATLLAEALPRAGRHDDVLPALDRALASAPDQPALRLNRGCALQRAHRPVEAREEFRALLAEHPDSPEVLCNLAGTLASCGQQDEAVAAARAATRRAPGSHLAWRMLANTLAYQDGRAAEMAAASREAGRLAPRALPPLDRPLSPALAGKRLRVGLLSANLRTHPVGWLALAGLETLDPTGYALVCLGQPPSADPMQRRFQAAAAEWHVVGGADAAARVRALDIDVLIDLGGYGDLGFMQLCAERLAPVQVKWVGLQNHGTGLAEMDWFVTDRWETPPALAGTYSERLLVMPDGYACYTPPPHAPEVAPPPALARGHVTFGCFNNYAKVTPALVATWAEVLRAMPSARMVLKTHQFDCPELAADARARFAAHGIDPDRIEPRGASGHRALLAQYADVDIVLDPHPYSGGVTTCEALWMGVPVVTMPGETFASRHSTSHLCNVGMGEWVAADRAGYVTLAVARAGDVAGLAALRAGLRARVRASPLCDAPRFGRNLGAALRGIWREACGGGS